MSTISQNVDNVLSPRNSSESIIGPENKTAVQMEEGVQGEDLSSNLVESRRGESRVSYTSHTQFYDNQLNTNSLLDNSKKLKRTPSFFEEDEYEYINIENDLGKSYIDCANYNISSNSLDVLALYIKGQKLLYTEAKTYCEQQLNFLMLPAIFISCVGSIFSFISENYSYGSIIIASLSGFNAFLLALISYLKLDAKAQAHKTSAYKFDKLESICEFNSGKFMFFKTTEYDILNVVEKIEKDVKEIKETNQFILPESIRYEFHFTYSTNIFTMVKKMQSREVAALHNLKICVNKLNSLKDQLNLAKTSGKNESTEELEKSIIAEETKRAEFSDYILSQRRSYYDLDTNFNSEIENHMKRVNQWFITRVICCDWLKS